MAEPFTAHVAGVVSAFKLREFTVTVTVPVSEQSEEESMSIAVYVVVVLGSATTV